MATAKKEALKDGAGSGHITNLKQSIWEFRISMGQTNSISMPPDQKVNKVDELTS